jgi:hypothetical protein
MADLIDVLAEQLAGAAGSGATVGQVTALAGTKVTVRIRGGLVTLPRLASYTPAVNDVVIVLPLGNDGAKIVLGKPA